MEKKIGKTGFVEQRSFWNIFRSFDRLWIGYLLVLQVHIRTLACDWGKFVEAW
jgi:callose synthase